MLTQFYAAVDYILYNCTVCFNVFWLYHKYAPRTCVNESTSQLFCIR